METVEHFAQIALVTHLLGRQQPLGQPELEKLIVARGKYEGSRSPASLPCGSAAGNNHGGRKAADRSAASESENRARLIKR